MNITYDDEVTSVVSSDQHRSARNEALEDEVVEQSVINFSEDYDDEEQDERRNLLYRGSGREAIERARQRALQRRQSPVIETATAASSDEDIVVNETIESPESVAASLREPVFEPDDFVEDENPSAEEAVDENDDALLSEGIRTLTPREARLRRFRDERPGPKDQIATKIEPAPDDVEMELPPSAAPERGRFDSIPEISAEIDLPLLRRSSSATRQRPVEPQPVADEPDDPPASYERALKRAHALNAAARAEENAARRVTTRAPRQEAAIEPGVIMPDLPDDDVEETITMRRPAPAAPASAQPARVQHPRQAPETRVRKRLIAAARPNQAPPTRTDDPRRSWWRGNRDTIDDDVLATPPREDEHGAMGLQDGLHFEQPPAPTPRPEAPALVNLDLERREDMDAFRNRLFASSAPRETDVEPDDAVRRNPITVTRRQRPISPAARERYRAQREPHHQESRKPERRLAPEHVETAQRPAPRPQRPRPAAAEEAREPRQMHPRQRPIEPEELLADPRDAWYEPAPEPDFDVRALIERDNGLLDMTIEIAEDVPRACATCRNYRPSEQPGRGWCTNTWAFTHRQMVNETDLACDSTIGCWWLPADKHVWLTDFEVADEPTPRVDRLIAHLDPERRVVGS